MPIRFTCPHCHQKLSVGQRKAGTAAECPRCRQTLTIPQPPAEPQTAAASVEAVKAPPIGEAAVFLPEPDDFAGLELVYDTASTSPPVKAPPAAADVIVLPRYVVYLQGGLLAAVALAAFAIGIAVGTTLVPRPAAKETASRITGSVTYASGPRRKADEGAVIVALPLTPHRPAEKAPIAGLRPTDPPPEPDNKGIAILREIGGNYARADANGHLELEVPSRGRYVVLVISHEKRSRSSDGAKPADIAKLAPFFDKPAGLLVDHRYRLTEEVIRGERELAIEFE